MLLKNFCFEFSFWTRNLIIKIYVCLLYVVCKENATSVVGKPVLDKLVCDNHFWRNMQNSGLWFVKNG